MLTLLLFMTAAQAQQKSPLSIALSEKDPVPGDALSMEVRWTNIYTQPVQIPANWTDEVKMWAWRENPGVKPSARRQAEAVQPRFFEAREIEWVTIAPGQTVTHALPFQIDDCKDGCVGGSYYGQININWGKSIQVDGRVKTQLLPAGQIPFNFDVRMPTEARAAADSLAAALITVSPPAEGDLNGTVRLTNQSGGGLWVPNPDQWAISCTLVDKKGMPAGMLSAKGGEAPATEDNHTLLADGATLDVPVSCKGIVAEGLPKKAALNVSLEPAVSFFPIQSHDARNVVTGSVASTEPYRVPKK